MASTIQIKRGTGSAVPSGLADGELAINLDDGRFYFGSGSTSVNSFRFTNLIADNYIVSSSVTNITTQTLSGSTQFGDSADDTHQFTGDITASGNISASGVVYADNIIVSSLSKGIAFSNMGLDTDQYIHGFGNVIKINGDNYVQIIADNEVKINAPKLGIGTIYSEDNSNQVPEALTVTGNISASGNIIAVSASIPGVIVGTPNLLSLGDPDANVGGVRAEINQNGTTSLLGNATLNLKGNTINIDSDAGGTAKINLLGHTTASGNISASGTIFTNFLQGTGDDVINLSVDGTTIINSDDVYVKGGNLRTDSDKSFFTNHITASGNISASGTIFTDEISSPTNNLIVSSSTVRLTATTDGEANLILEADSDNNDENDNPFMDLLQDGGGIAGQIGISGGADKWPDGSALSGTSINSMVIGMKGASSGDNRELIFATADTVALKLDNTQDARFYGNVTNNTNGLYITGDVSASGDLYAGDDLIVGDDITMTSANAAIFMGDSGNEYTVGVGQGGFIINAGVTNPASVSHFIVSASGGTADSDARVGIGIIPHHTDMLNVSGGIRAQSATIGGDITLADTKKLKGVRIVISASNNNNIYGTTTFHQNISLNGTTTFNDVISGDTTLQGNLRLGGSGDTSNNWISIDAQNGNDSSGGGITFYETGTYDVDSPQYGAKIVYNEDDDEFAIGTMDNNTFMRQIYMKRNSDRVYLANQIRVEGTSPLLIIDNTSTTVADGDTLGQIAFNDDDDGGSILNIKGIATEDHASGTSGGSKFEFQITPNGTSTLATAVTIDQDKSLTVNNHITASGNISSSGEIISATSKIGLRNLGGRSDDLHNGPTGSTAQGDIFYHSGVSTVAGKIYTFQTNGNVILADKDAGSTATGSLFMAVGASSADGMLLRGMVKIHTDVTANPGHPLYLGDDGLVTTTIPSSGDFARIIGHYQSGSGLIYFNPDNTFVEIS